MIPKRTDHSQEEGTDSWLMSYADMITLLMCFFIIFVSVSEPKKDKFSLITDGIASKFGSVDMSTPLQGVYSSLQGIIENNQLFRDMAIQKNEKSIEMELASGSFFKRRSAEFDPDKLQILTEMAETLKKGAYLDYRVLIEGHTSDAPINTTMFPSNWELSTARASRVVRYFIEHGMEPDRLVAIGYGDSQPKAANRDAGGNVIRENRALNERIVIKFERGH